MDGAGAHAQSGVESGLEVGRVRRAICDSLYHAIFISNVETGETKQVTDGLADAVWPVWDASGKYLWFLASTDFGLQVAVARHDVATTTTRPSGCTSRC